MENDEEINDDQKIMAAYVISKFDFIKKVLFAPLRAKYVGGTNIEEPARDILMTELCLKLNVSPDAAIDFVKALNIQEFVQ